MILQGLPLTPIVHIYTFHFCTFILYSVCALDPETLLIFRNYIRAEFTKSDFSAEIIPRCKKFIFPKTLKLALKCLKYLIAILPLVT